MSACSPSANGSDDWAAPAATGDSGVVQGSGGSGVVQSSGGSGVVQSSGGSGVVQGSGGVGTGGVGAGGSVQNGPEPYRLSIVIPNVGPGEEGTQCIQTRLPNADAINVIKLHNTLSDGSHHFIVSALMAADATEMPLTACKPFRAALQGGPLAITQKHDDTVATPDGVAYALDANQLISLELHYINTTSDVIQVEAQTEIYPAADGANLQPGSVLLIGTTSFSLLPQTTASTGPRFIPMPPELDGVSYFAITGHTHQLGTAVKVSSAANALAPQTLLYAPTPFQWDSPPLEELSPAAQIPTGGGFVLQCDWDNTTDNTVTWGESALDEMCFFWAYYYPKRTVGTLILEGIGPLDATLVKQLGL